MLRSHSFLLCLLSCFITHLPAISGAVAAAEPDVSLNVKKGICDISYSNNKFDKQIEIWEKENDWHANDNFLKVVTFPAALDKSTISIQVLPESVDANGDPHETMCLGIMITCLDINSPNSRNYKSIHYAPKKFVELEGGDEKNKYCVNHFPASKPAWIIEINFYKAAIGHAFLVQPTILSINELPLDLETGTYTDALKKMNDEKPFYFNYELMERTMRNDPLGGDHNSHGFRRLSFFVKSELVDELELDDGSESDFFSMDGSHFDFPNFA